MELVLLKKSAHEFLYTALSSNRKIHLLQKETLVVKIMFFDLKIVDYYILQNRQIHRLI